jgi:predicted PurR-regulated permease PerM
MDFNDDLENREEKNQDICDREGGEGNIILASSPPSYNSKIWQQLSTNSLIRFLLFFACGWTLLQVFSYFEYVIFIFTFAAILALILNYPVKYLERFLGRGSARGIVIGLSLLIILILLSFLGLTISIQFEQLFNTITQALNSSDDILRPLERLFRAKNINFNLEPLKSQLQTILTSGIGAAATSLPSLLNNFLSFILILIISFFMLSDGEKLWQLILKLIPHHHRSRVATAIQQNLLGFLQAKLLTSLLLDVVALIVFLIFQIPFSFPLAIIFGTSNLIPGIGGPLGSLVIALIVLLQSGWISTLKVLIICTAVQQLENIISARLMQSTINLNPVVVFFALLVGAKIAGLLGIFLSVPIAGVIASLLEIDEMKSS